jgi:hypothetical protein
VVLEKRKVSILQEISDEFVDQQEQRPIYLKEANIIPELKEMSLGSIIGTTSEYLGDNTITIINSESSSPEPPLQKASSPESLLSNMSGRLAAADSLRLVRRGWLGRVRQAWLPRCPTCMSRLHCCRCLGCTAVPCLPLSDPPPSPPRPSCTLSKRSLLRLVSPLHLPGNATSASDQPTD